jgi:hypothetical protein
MGFFLAFMMLGSVAYLQGKAGGQGGGGGWVKVLATVRGPGSAAEAMGLCL